MAKIAAMATPVIAHMIPEFCVPLGPERRKIAKLIAARARVPEFSDEFDLAHDGVLLNDIEKRRHSIDIVNASSQGRCRVETESVDVHFRDPISKRIHHQLQTKRMPDVEAVTRTRVVLVIERVFIGRSL